MTTNPLPPPVNIGSRLELFVDHTLIDSLHNLDMRLQTPVRQPLPDRPLTGAYATVIQDQDMFRAYYRDLDPAYSGPSGYSGHPGEITAYAESRDGHEWTFPALNLYPTNGTLGNNVVLAHQPPFHHNFSPFLDPRPDIDPSERYKAVAGHPGFERTIKADGLHAFTSPDGLHWRKAGDTPIIPFDPSWSHAFDSQNVAFWSDAEQLYVCYFRTWQSCDDAEHDKPHPGDGHPEAGHQGALRSISRATSPDFQHWSPPLPMHPNLPGEHLYTSQTHPYFRAPHIYIALPTRYVAGRVGMQATESMLGSTDILFMTTRAGSTRYDRLFTDAFIRPGLDPDRWQSRGNYVALNVLPTAPNEMSIWHSRSGHRYTLRTDGFIAVHAGAGRGELVTRPLIFSGRELTLNYSSAAAGGVQVEIQDIHGTPLNGFSLADCPMLVGDSIQQTVHWNHHPDLAGLAGRPLRLRFVMREADLFALQFQTA